MDFCLVFLFLKALFLVPPVNGFTYMSAYRNIVQYLHCYFPYDMPKYKTDNKKCSINKC